LPRSARRPEVVPRLTTHKHWTRKDLAEWLIERLSEA
jgi:hypothetical protein